MAQRTMAFQDVIWGTLIPVFEAVAQIGENVHGISLGRPFQDLVELLFLLLFLLDPPMSLDRLRIVFFFTHYSIGYFASSSTF